MNKLKKWKKEVEEIARLNKELHESGEFLRDEFIITPPVPEPCGGCIYNIKSDCIMDNCYNNDKFSMR